MLATYPRPLKLCGNDQIHDFLVHDRTRRRNIGTLGGGSLALLSAYNPRALLGFKLRDSREAIRFVFWEMSM